MVAEWEIQSSQTTSTKEVWFAFCNFQSKNAWFSHLYCETEWLNASNDRESRCVLPSFTLSKIRKSFSFAAFSFSRCKCKPRCKLSIFHYFLVFLRCFGFFDVVPYASFCQLSRLFCVKHFFIFYSAAFSLIRPTWKNHTRKTWIQLLTKLTYIMHDIHIKYKCVTCI